MTNKADETCSPLLSSLQPGHPAWLTCHLKLHHKRLIQPALSLAPPTTYNSPFLCLLLDLSALLWPACGGHFLVSSARCAVNSSPVFSNSWTTYESCNLQILSSFLNCTFLWSKNHGLSVSLCLFLLGAVLLYWLNIEWVNYWLKQIHHKQIM